MYRLVIGTQPHNTRPGIVVLHLECGHYVFQAAKDKAPRYAACPYCQVSSQPQPKREVALH